MTVGHRSAARSTARWRFGATMLAGACLGYALLRSRRRRKAAADTAAFRDAVVLITGGSRGLGFALARAFAQEGAHLALLARTEDQLERAAQRLREDFGARVLAVPCDVRDEAAVVRAVSLIVSQMGRLDVLVNNAGVIQVTPFAHAQTQDFLDSIDTHFWGPYFLTRTCLPHLADRRGRIVNISSIGGRVSVPHLLPYGVGKFALVGFSEGLHAELRREGVSVTTVTPHLMQTGSHRNVVVRGRHALEATWFALGTMSRWTALDANDVARTVVEMARARRASVTPGWQARAAAVMNALMPETTAAIAAAATWALPSRTEPTTGDVGRWSRDIHVGLPAKLFPTDAARDLNQTIAADEV